MRGGDKASKGWIADQQNVRFCTVMLVGTDTAKRKWINHEIIKSWDDGKGVVGIHIYGLRNRDGSISRDGLNPSDDIGYGSTGKKLSAIVKCYDPSGTNRRQRYDWFRTHLSNAVNEAVAIKTRH